ncbi:MAG: chemosensory pili system protein ChpE [Thermomicrobiales bacterium]|nr:chemosensory pili system protein ChpE [Thermomicrobiales bacterium]
MAGVELMVPAFGLGLAYAATPGIVNAECIRRGMAHGFRPAISVQLGALLGAVVWAALALGGVAALARRESFAIALGLGGSLFLCRLAFTALREAWSGPRERSPVVSRYGDLGTGVVFGLANPAGLAFWAGVGGGMLAASGSDAGIAFTVYVLFLAAFIVGAFCWSLGLAALVGWGRRYARPRVFRAIDAVCGTFLGLFGVRLLWATVRRISL